MRILALETSELIGTVAAMQDSNLLAEIKLSSKQRTAESLVPTLRKLWNQVGWRPADIGLVALTIGPGSFTGLRIGVTAAKTLAYALGAEVLGIDTLETIAAAAPPEVRSLSVAISAQRGDVVAGEFQRSDDGWLHPAGRALLLPVDVWFDRLRPGTFIAGPVLRKLSRRVPAHLIMINPQYWSPKAAAVARLAARDHAAGRRDDLWKLVPKYSRRSAAEEKLERG